MSIDTYLYSKAFNDFAENKRKHSILRIISTIILYIVLLPLALLFGILIGVLVIPPEILHEVTNNDWEEIL